MRSRTISLLLAVSAGLLGYSSHSQGADDPPGAKQPAANRLAKETSPYLLLHAHNPVDWYPWGPEALAKAKAENKPIFLSVGYSSCYWCHVMERESFTDPEIARILNANFVCIKVDREERPDVDQVYMAALQALGPGGWPMSLFLTPDGRPFFGGTYSPPRDRQGTSGFLTIITEVTKAWTARRDEIDKAAVALTDAAQRRLKGASSLGQLPLSRTAAAEGRQQLGAAIRPRVRRLWLQPQQSAATQVPRAGRLALPAGSTSPRRPLERRPRPAQDGPLDSRSNGARGHPRPVGRRLSPLCDGPLLACTAL